MWKLSILPLSLILLQAAACHHDPVHHGDKHGSHKHQHKSNQGDQTFVPFDDIDEYIAHLENDDRPKWQKPDQVVASLALEGGETVVDVGAGSGYFTFRFSKALKTGRVLALDIIPDMLDHIRIQAEKAKISNVSTKVVKAADPQIPSEADLVFVCNVFHHIADQQAWLKAAFSQMKQGSRLVMIEFKLDSPIGPPEDIRIAPESLQTQLSAAGFVHKSTDLDLLPYQYLSEFSRP